MRENVCRVKIGIIGGSGVDKEEILKEKVVIPAPETKFGKPSSDIVTGKIGGVEVAIILRHGKGHTIIPSNVPNRANIQALKDLGVTHILATTACGSLREGIMPGDLVFPDQFIDRTTKRASTFHEGPEVQHVPMGDPCCGETRAVLIETAKELGLRYHGKGTVITIEGPRFSTRAESRMFQQWGADIINMSTVPEIVLANEAGICYASIAMATDYDCFDESRPAVTWGEVLRVMKQNVDNVLKLLYAAIPKINEATCTCKARGEESVME